MAAAALAEKAGWDRLLRLWPRANLLQSVGWGEVQSRAGWSVERLLVETGRGQLPVTALLGASGIPGRTRLYVPRGPACGPRDLEAFAQAQAALLELGRSRRSLAVEVEVPWTEAELDPAHPFLRWAPAPARQPLATVVVDLAPEPEQIMASFHSKTRYNVHLGERRGVRVRGGRLEELVACLRATERRQGIRLPSKRHLGNVLEQLAEGAEVEVADVGGEAVAAVLVARFGEEAIYLYGGASGVHRELMPNHLLHWRAMMRAREQGCRSYDLWGIPETDRADHPWHGLAQFKLGFGGRRLRYAGCRRQGLVPGGARLVSLADAARSRARRWRSP